jgi:HPt (histidine-containing phosphotransfer) domain-containing protein|tara:strand:- start:96 stop:431 length:336 start_codon:yes stop_codon:yes gene_type:complete
MADELIDYATLNELSETVGADFVAELIGTFLEEAPSMIAELRTTLASGEAEAFRRAAHSLKTNANTFGAQLLGRAALALEQGGLPGDAAALDALDSLYTQTAAALQAAGNG